MHRILFPYQQINPDRPKSTPAFLTAIAQHSFDGILHNSPVGNDAPISVSSSGSMRFVRHFHERTGSGLAYVCFKSLRPKDKNPELFSAKGS
jgi:hypothetical protein